MLATAAPVAAGAEPEAVVDLPADVGPAAEVGEPAAVVELWYEATLLTTGTVEFTAAGVVGTTTGAVVTGTTEAAEETLTEL